MLKARRVPPRITPNLMAEMLPVTMKERKPPRERAKPALQKKNMGKEKKKHILKTPAITFS